MTAAPPCPALPDRLPSAKVRRFYWLAGLFLFAALIALAADMPAARFFSHDRALPGDVRRTINITEAFAHGAGVAMIAMTVWALDVTRRRRLARILTCAWGSGMLANLVKISVARTRPHATDFADGALSTFHGFFPWLDAANTNAWEAAYQSFPSAHSATAVGLAMGLGWAYPQGAGWFAVLAALASAQRLVCGSHFPSDVAAGAALGLAFSALCLDERFLGRWFNRWE